MGNTVIFFLSLFLFAYMRDYISSPQPSVRDIDIFSKESILYLYIQEHKPKTLKRPCFFKYFF